MASNLPFTGLPVYPRSFAAEAAQDHVIIWEPRRKKDSTFYRGAQLLSVTRT